MPYGCMIVLLMSTGRPKHKDLHGAFYSMGAYENGTILTKRVGKYTPALLTCLTGKLSEIMSFLSPEWTASVI